MFPAIGTTCFPEPSGESEEARFFFQSINTSIHPSTHHPSTCKSICPSTYSFTYLPIHPPIHPSIPTSVHLSTYLSTNSFTYLSISPSILHSPVHPSINLPAHSSTHPYTLCHLSTHPPHLHPIEPPMPDTGLQCRARQGSLGVS